MTLPGRLTTSIERTKCPPWGLEGGEPGATGRVEVVRHDGARATLLKGETQLAAGDRVLLSTAGGGGFGAPRTRCADALADDLAQGYVSPEAARTRYGRPAAATEFEQTRRKDT
jgi:N-methylhydantoinase B